MSKVEKQPAPTTDPGEAEVAHYLASHPDFLRTHPDTLEVMDIPHNTGDAVSLIEHQIQILRDTNHKLRARFDELVYTAEANEKRVVQLNRLACLMAGATSFDGLTHALEQELSDSLSVDALFIGIDGIGSKDDAKKINVLGESADVDKILVNAFRRGKPVCSGLKPAQSETLFGTMDVPMASVAMIPLAPGGTRSIVVLASRDPKHFTADMGTLFLEQLSALFSATFSRLLADGR